MEQSQIESVMNIIANAGNAKSEAMLGIREVKNMDYKKAKEHLKSAEESINLAHNSQTELLTKEAQGNEFEVNLLTVHSQDHLMNAITFIDLAREIIDISELHHPSTN